MATRIKCSLVIATYNWPAALHVCLLSVMKQKLLPDEIIIADDGSRPDTHSVIQHFQKISPSLIHHVWHKDAGFRKTIILNKAIRKCSFEYIIQIDGDVILEEHFIADHLASAELGVFIRGTRAMITPAVTTEILASQRAKLSWFSAGVTHRNNALRLFALKAIGARKVMSSNSVRGSNLSYWKADYALVNGYDNDLNGWGHEDEELAARFINNGIIKKIVKLCAVQFHLWHQPADKDNEPLQRRVIDKVKQANIKACINGYLQADNYE